VCSLPDTCSTRSRELTQGESNAAVKWGTCDIAAIGVQPVAPPPYQTTVNTCMGP